MKILFKKLFILDSERGSYSGFITVTMPRKTQTTNYKKLLKMGF